jgi:hypothetical protein
VVLFDVKIVALESVLIFFNLQSYQAGITGVFCGHVLAGGSVIGERDGNSNRKGEEFQGTAWA